MREGNLDNILRKIEKRHSRVLSKIEGNLKGIKPFAQPVFEPEEVLYHYDNLGEQDMDDLENEFGQVALSNLIQKIDKIRRRQNA